MDALENKIDQLKSKIEQYESEREWLLTRYDEEERDYYDRLDEIRDLEYELDDINAEIDDRLVTMDECKEQALDLVDEFKYIPMNSVRERKELIADIKYMSTEYKEEKHIIEQLLDEVDEIKKRIDELEELGDKVLNNIEDEIVLREDKIKTSKQAVEELEQTLHDTTIQLLDEVMIELRKRSAGNKCPDIDNLTAINPDLAEKITLLSDRSLHVLGTPFEDYLILEGVLK